MKRRKHPLEISADALRWNCKPSQLGISGVFATHMILNIGMSLGLMPVIGVPLPFLSYGGSALMANMCMVGILMNLYAHRKEY